MDLDFNQSELIHNLKPFMGFLLSLRKDKPIPILRDLAVLVTDTREGDRKIDFLKRKIDRVYVRLCRLQEELSSLNLKNASPKISLGFTLEDYVFSGIDFFRYREIRQEVFESFFLEGMADFSDSFFRKNFSLGNGEIRLLIEESYVKTDEIYKLQKENSLILSVMRTLEISLETSPLFTIEEIQGELDYLQSLVGADRKMPEAGKLFSLLALSLKNTNIAHTDGMITKLSISPQGDLAGTFRPGDKPWTKVLIPGS